MAKKKGGSEFSSGDITLGTEAWNVAQGYTHMKILRQLIMLDRWETLAQFGTEEIDEDLVYNDHQIRKRRVEALQRFHSTLRQLLGNVYFALTKNDQISVMIYIDRIKLIDEFMPKVYKINSDRVTHEEMFEIKEDMFKKILEIMQDIKDKLNTQLNNSSLIFRLSDEVDLDKIMNDIVKSG